MTASPLLNQLIKQLQILPGVGPRSAQRMAFSLLKQADTPVFALAEAIAKVKKEVKECHHCRNYTEETICRICHDTSRDGSQLCVVETPAELASLESSQVFKGYYFVLHGRLSPLDGIGPEALGLDRFEKRLAQPELKEVILATNATIEGEATSYYLTELAKQAGKKVSRIAYGVPVGGELEFIDSQTLSHALMTRKVVD